MAVRQRAVLDGEITHLVLDREWRVVLAVEAYLEHLRQEKYSPNTVRAYAQGLASWWSMLEEQALDWTRVGVSDLVRFRRDFSGKLHARGAAGSRSSGQPSSSSVDQALTAVLSFYRYHATMSDIPAAREFYLRVSGGSLQARGSYASFLGHLRRVATSRAVGRRRGPGSPPPFFTPSQIATIKDDAARFDSSGQTWSGDLRLRLFWSLLEETGLRLAEALLLQHRDWVPGLGSTAFLDVQPREDQRRRLRVKGQRHRRIYVSDELDGLYGEYLFLLGDLGIEFDDCDPVFVNLYRGQVGAPMRSEGVYDWIEGCRRRHPLLPAGWTPHWFRHTHATTLLLAGVPEHVVQRRMGHSDIKTLLTTYAHVTEDAAMRAAGDWISADRPLEGVGLSGIPRCERRRTARSDPRLDHRSLFSREINGRLAAALPPEVRGDYFTRTTMPSHWLEAVLENQPSYRRREKSVALNFRGLPESMVTEFVWSVERQVRLGMRIPAQHTTKLARQIAMVVADRSDPAI